MQVATNPATSGQIKLRRGQVQIDYRRLSGADPSRGGDSTVKAMAGIDRDFAGGQFDCDGARRVKEDFPMLSVEVTDPCIRH